MSEPKIMSRGKSQALYKYLPDAYIDFSVSGEARGQYVAKVKQWNTIKLEDINTERLIRTVNQTINSYRTQEKTKEATRAEPTLGFADKLTPENCEVLTPIDENSGTAITANLTPRTFYCQTCKKIYQFKPEEAGSLDFRCEDDGTPLSQFRRIYFCTCGYASGYHNIRCPNDPAKYPDEPTHKNICLYDNYHLTCKTCGKTFELLRQCPDCGASLQPKNALDSAQYFSYSLNLIDLIDKNTERFISDVDYGKYLTILNWLGELSDEELNEAIAGSVKYIDIYRENYEKFLPVFGEGTAEESARQIADKTCGNTYYSQTEAIKNKLMHCKTGITQSSIAGTAETILEYKMVHNIEGYVTLKDAADMAKQLNTSPYPEESFMSAAARLGIADIRACDGIPFVSCSYGYTRVKNEYEPNVTLRAFRARKSKNNGNDNKKDIEENNKKTKIYALKMNTEGVLFEFDRRKILKWLNKNKDTFDITSVLPDADTATDEEIKLWFITNIDPEAIKPFTALSPAMNPETCYVYRLIHSVSHLLIRAAAEIGGLGRDSFSEYIFPGIPAVLIYVQNSQGFNLGSLMYTFEARFDLWMEKALEDSKVCIYDPICLERYKACTGCLFLNEVSCQHYNKDLDRSLITGYTDKLKGKRTYGFWEEEI